MARGRHRQDPPVVVVAGLRFEERGPTDREIVEALGYLPPPHPSKVHMLGLSHTRLDLDEYAQAEQSGDRLRPF
jgi:hypothetical protein